MLLCLPFFFSYLLCHGDPGTLESPTFLSPELPKEFQPSKSILPKALFLIPNAPPSLSTSLLQVYQPYYQCPHFDSTGLFVLDTETEPRCQPGSSTRVCTGTARGGYPFQSGLELMNSGRTTGTNSPVQSHFQVLFLEYLVWQTEDQPARPASDCPPGEEVAGGGEEGKDRSEQPAEAKSFSSFKLSLPLWVLMA